MSLIWRLHTASWAALMADHFVPDFISGYAFRMISAAESFIMWRCTFPIFNSSDSEDIGGSRFPEWYINPLSKNKELLATYACIFCYTVESVQYEISQSCISVRAAKDGVADHVGNTNPSSFRTDKFCQLI